MNDNTSTKEELRAIDARLTELFVKRLELCRELNDPRAKIKHIDTNSAEILAQLDAKDSGIASFCAPFFNSVFRLSEQYLEYLTHGMTVAYSGTDGAYAQIAAKKLFPNAVLASYGDFSGAYRAVEDGCCDCVVLPLENSSAGEVGAVTDLIFSGSLFINRIANLSVLHCLLSVAGASSDSITTVISHPQALEQCAEYISSHGFQTMSSSSTANAAEQVSLCADPSLAAIASRETADIYGLNILDSDINDSIDNTTRFAVLSRVPNRADSSTAHDRERFVLVFTVRNQAGSLAQTLNIIGAHGYNLLSLRSHPMKKLQWGYYFYAEAEGDINNANGREMLHKLSVVCARLKLAGTYSADSEGNKI